MLKFVVSYCHHVRGFRKDTNFWADYPPLLEVFVHPNGTMKQECSDACSPCSYKGKHLQVRPTKGDAGRADRGSIYPDGLCRALALAGAPLYGKVCIHRATRSSTHLPFSLLSCFGPLALYSLLCPGTHDETRPCEYC